MTAQARALLCEALALPDEDRADVAAELLASLEGSATDDPETRAKPVEPGARAAAKPVLSGEATGEEWSSVRQRLADELAG